MSDPLSDVITLLKPRAVFSKGISGAGRWAVRYSAFGLPSFCAVLEGSCLLAVDDQPVLTLEAGDFLLLPRTPAFTMSGFDPVEPLHIQPLKAVTPIDEVRHGDLDAPADVRLLGGHFVFESPDATLLAQMLPARLHVRDRERLTTLVRFVREESMGQGAGRELILTRLVEMLLIEALRATPEAEAPPGLIRGLADPRLAKVLQQMHGDIACPWTVPQLAKIAALSRSAFFKRFNHTLGQAPMEYLLAWRMAVAKDLLRGSAAGMIEVAERVGYSSASAFSTAFSRHMGVSPSHYRSEGGRALA
ncbi:AraC family transcriptional regulator [Pseudomonas sp. B2M1-30]|uniref:AraC family transcriptional regulator n=1 Tax=Pseudomonas TaxID=286 RepID=UPI0021C90800|nr:MULTISPECIES: AraC family transcriptional regulator [Pseudomonas]MCU0121757.1 AraC family transcriptional regulator [Pseudomonas sp. B2M1-30]MCU7263855.1 AraC family transcriptional regulator [Pseudomonas koreensis]